MDKKKLNQIQDFGEYTWGAKKDLANSGVRLEDLAEMTDSEQLKYVVKKNVWKKPDYQQMLADGWDREAVYYYKTVLDAAPTKPDYLVIDDADRIHQKMAEYVTVLSFIAGFMWHVRTIEDVQQCIREAYRGEISLPARYTGYYRKMMIALSRTYSRLVRDMERKQFLYTEDEIVLSRYHILFYSNRCEWKDSPNGICLAVAVPGGTHFLYPKGEYADKEQYRVGTYLAVNYRRDFVGFNYPSEEDAKQAILKMEKEKKETPELKKPETKRKGAFVPPILQHIKREGGSEYLTGHHADGEMYMKDFQFRGGQFGNWLSDKERQANLDMAYESFKDLAFALDIRETDIAFGGRLSIAFGARGRGTAMAHYEPASEIINLTKMKGAGSLGHEWIHALDRYTAQVYELPKMMTEHLTHGTYFLKKKIETPESFKALMHTIKYRVCSADEAKAMLIKQRDDMLSAFRKELYSISYAKDDQQREEMEKCFDTLIDEMRSTMGYSNIVPGKGSALALVDHDRKPSPAYQKLIDQQKEAGSGNVARKQNCAWCNSRRAQVSALNDRIAHPEPMKVDTFFVQAARLLDETYRKSDKGYWASDVELLARAGAAYIKDKCKEKGIRNDYLSGHADSFSLDMNMDKIYVSPQGEERKKINAAFDAFFNEMRTLGFLGKYEEKKPTDDEPAVTTQESASIAASKAFWESCTVMEDGGQMVLF